MKTDTFRTTIFWAETAGRFQIFDYRERPGPGSWVMVEQTRNDAGGVVEAVIQRFSGQSFIAVVRWLDFYPLQYSEQYTPPRPEPTKARPAPKPKKQKKPPKPRNPFPKKLAC